MKILIDNGHGSNTPGKCSPDGRLREYSYTREIAGRVVFELRKLGIDAELVVKEEIDVRVQIVLRQHLSPAEGEGRNRKESLCHRR